MLNKSRKANRGKIKMSDSIQIATAQAGPLPSADRSVSNGAHKVWLSPSVRVITSPDGAALLDVRAGTCLALNVTGLFIWERIHTGQTEDEIVAALSKECGEPSENVRRGYESFVGKLLDHHLAGLTPEAFSEPQQRGWSLLGLLKRIFGQGRQR
jgi:hypothetical protein